MTIRRVEQLDYQNQAHLHARYQKEGCAHAGQPTELEAASAYEDGVYLFECEGCGVTRKWFVYRGLWFADREKATHDG